jgi:hypothetical protein
VEPDPISRVDPRVRYQRIDVTDLVGRENENVKASQPSQGIEVTDLVFSEL